VPLHIDHPVWMLTFLVLTAVTFSLFGFIIGIWADGFEKLQMIPMLVVTPLTFLGGSFYSVNMLPPGWRTLTLFNPVVYLISGFRWSFYERRRRQRRRERPGSRKARTSPARCVRPRRSAAWSACGRRRAGWLRGRPPIHSTRSLCSGPWRAM
jgi:hypothetical protein